MIEEEAWDRRKRSRLEEEEDKLAKDRVEKFKKSKAAHAQEAIYETDEEEFKGEDDDDKDLEPTSNRPVQLVILGQSNFHII